MSWFNLIPENLNLKERINPFLKDKLPLAPSEFDVVAHVSGMKLLRFKKKPILEADCGVRTPLFIIPSMINRYYVLDLLPGKSLIEYFLDRGIDVYLLDWGVPLDEDNWLSFEELITHRLDYFVDLALSDSKKSKINLFGHCLGGTLSAIYSVLFQEKINGTLLLTAPIDFEHGGKLGYWVNQGFNPENVTKAYGHMPWWVLQSSFQMLKPMLPWQKLEKIVKEFKNPEFMKNFWALEVWSQDNVSFPGRCFVTIIDELYKKNALAKGLLKVGSQPVLLGQLKGPVLNIAATDDHIVLFNSTLQNYHLDNGAELESISAQGGHISALLGSRAQKTLWPQLIEWFSKIETAKH